MYFCLGMTQENDIAARARQDVLVIHRLKTFRLYSSTAQIQNLYCTVCICFSPFSLSSSLFQKQLLIRRQKDSMSVEPAGEESTNSHGLLIKQRQLHKEREKTKRQKQSEKGEADGQTHGQRIDICTEARNWLLFCLSIPSRQKTQRRCTMAY